MDENKEDETLQSIQKMYKRYNIVYATYAKTVNETDVIVISLVRCFEIRDKKNTNLISSNTWMTLNNLNIRGQKIDLSFTKESIEFFTADAQIFFESICDILQRVLLPNELEKLNFSRFNAYPVYPTPFSIRKRISMMKKESGIEYYDETETKLDDLLKIGSNTLDISVFPKMAKIILDSLSLFNFVKYLTIPELPDYPVYQKLDSILPECGFLRHLKVSNKVDSYFNRFLTTIINSTSKISSLGFGPTTALTVDNFKQIRSKIVNSRIHSLEFNKAFDNPPDEELSSDIYTLFDGQLGTQLWSLNMKETTNINFNLLLPKLRYITSLSFEDCGIEIDNFLAVLCQSKMENLTYLNLNKNVCGEKISKTLEFPSSLTHISVNDVSWKKNSLVTFFKFFLNQRDEIHLSIARSSSYKEQWDKLFNFLSVSKCTNFRTLIWDRNPVCEALLNFLKQNDKLSYLSMSGCFSNKESDDEKSLILLMFEYIKEARSLKTLVIEGNDEAYLGEKFPVIIDACVLHPSLSVLDLSFSKCGNVGIGFLIPLIKRGKLNIQVLNIEGAYVQGEDQRTCLNLYKELTESASDVFVSFPQTENDELLENKSQQTKQKFQLLFRSKNTFLANQELEGNNDGNDYQFKKFSNSPFYLYPLNHYTPEVLFPIFFEELERKQLNFQASKRNKAALTISKRRKDNSELDVEEEEEENTELNFEDGGMKFSEVPQRAILKNIIREMPSPKSPNAIAVSSLMSSDTESQIEKDKNKDDYEYSTVASSVTNNNIIKTKEKPVTTPHSPHKPNSPHTPNSPNKSNSPHKSNSPRSPNSKRINSNENIEKVSKVNSPKNINKNDDKMNNEDENNNEVEENNYMLSEFNKREIISFTKKYKINRTIPFPNLKNPKQIMEDKWNKIDDNYSLESLFSVLKNQKSTIQDK